MFILLKHHNFLKSLLWYKIKTIYQQLICLPFPNSLYVLSLRMHFLLSFNYQSSQNLPFRYSARSKNQVILLMKQTHTNQNSTSCFTLFTTLRIKFIVTYSYTSPKTHSIQLIIMAADQDAHVGNYHQDPHQLIARQYFKRYHITILFTTYLLLIHYY